MWAITIVVALSIGLWIKDSLYTAVYILLGLNLTVGAIWHMLIAKIGEIQYLALIRHFIKTFIAVILVGWLGSTILDMFVITNNFIHIILGSVICGALYIIYLIAFEKKLIRIILEMR